MCFYMQQLNITYIIGTYGGGFRRTEFESFLRPEPENHSGLTLVSSFAHDSPLIDCSFLHP